MTMQRIANPTRGALVCAVLLTACPDDPNGAEDSTASTGAAATSTDDAATDSPLPTDGTGNASTEGSSSAGSGSTSNIDDTTGATGDAVCQRDDVIELAAARSGLHPEGIAADAQGRLYVSGFISGEILRVDSCTGEVESFAGPRGNVAGVLVDDEAGVLWACVTDFGMMPPNPRATAIDLSDGSVRSTHAFPADGGICNDMTFDGDGNLYLTDSFANRVLRIAAADTALEGPQTGTATVWSEDAAFGAILPGTFGLNGIAWAGGDALYVVGFHGHISDDDPMELDPSHLYRVPIQADGDAGPAEVIGNVPFGDGLEWVEGTTFLVNEQSSTLSRMDIDGGVSLTPLQTGMDFSTTTAVVGDEAWVVEGQLDHFLDPELGPATDPFILRRVSLD